MNHIGEKLHNHVSNVVYYAMASALNSNRITINRHDVLNSFNTLNRGILHGGNRLRRIDEDDDDVNIITSDDEYEDDQFIIQDIRESDNFTIPDNNDEDDDDFTFHISQNKFNQLARNVSKKFTPRVRFMKNALKIMRKDAEKFINFN
jgi:histone H3/H4